MGAYDLIVGVYLLGILLNTFLFGLVCYQFAVYKSTKFDDPKWMKTLVVSLFFIDVLHSAVEVYGAWEMCVENYANPAALQFVSWVIPFTACATAIAAVLTQGFLGYRVLCMTKSKILTAVIGITSIVGCIGGFVAGIKSGLISDVTRFGPLRPYVILWLAPQTITDVLITICLSITLTRSRTGFRKTDSIINRLVRNAVQTGFFVSLFALGDLFSFTLANNTNLYAFFAFPLGRIYTNTLLDTLNSRNEIKNLGGGAIDMDTESNAVAFRMHTSKSSTTAGQGVRSITVTKDVVTDSVQEEQSLDGKAKGASSTWYDPA